MRRKLLWLLPLPGALVLVLVLALLWHVRFQARFHTSIRHWAGFGASAAQCAAAYQPAAVTTTSRDLVQPTTRCYVQDGWNLLVGFDEKGAAEQFVISKATLLSTPELTTAEQDKLRAEFSDGSRWLYRDDNQGIGPLWEREDGLAYASYIRSARYMVLMNRAGMERQLRRIQEEAAAKGDR